MSGFVPLSGAFYTPPMSAVILLWWFALGQTPPGSHVEVVPEPGELPLIFELVPGATTRDGRTTVVGYVDDPNWESARVVHVELDEPWNTGRSRSLILNRADIRDPALPEQANEWRARHLEGWASAGYVNVGKGDTFYFVREAEAERARRAHELDHAREPAAGAIQAEAVAAADENAAPGETAAGWAKHIVIVVLGLVLAALVLKTLVLQ